MRNKHYEHILSF